MTSDNQEVVHIFSVHVPGDRHSSFVWRHIQPGHETLTYDEILEAEREVQKCLSGSIPETAIVKYFATAGGASNHQTSG